MMDRVYRTRQFERSFRKLRRSGRLTSRLKDEIDAVIFALAAHETLAAHHRDHELTGEYKHYRECHIRNDLLLIYTRNEESIILVLIDIGTHAQLFG